MTSDAPSDTVTDSPSTTISEATFLLTELRYTLGQMHVQVGDLDERARKDAMCGDRSVEDILQAMLRSEDEYQQTYSRFIGSAASTESAADEEIPLPVSQDEDETSLNQNDFEHRRAHTIHMLEDAGENWPDELLETVKRQVAEDRRHTTDLAECRKAYLNKDTRGDLDEPLPAAYDPSGNTGAPLVGENTGPSSESATAS